MEQNVSGISVTAVHARDSNSSTVPVQHLECSTLSRYAVRAAAFEAVIEAFDIGQDLIKTWGDLIFISIIAVLASFQFVSGVLENHMAVFVKRNSSISAQPGANDVDPSAVLVQKVEIIPSVISEAAYEAAVEALHSLPDRIWNLDDLMKAFKSLLQCSYAFVSLAVKKYKTWLTARNSPPSTVLNTSDSQLSAMFEAFESNIVEVLDSLPDEIPHRQDMINTSQSLCRSFQLFITRVRRDFLSGKPASQAKRPFLRLWEVFCHPSQFATIFLNFCSLVRSLRDGRQSGPEVILPMSSPTKRPSCRLAKRLLDHSRDLPQDEFGADVSLSATSHPWTVAMIDLNAVPLDIAEGRYSTGADVYGLASILFLVEILEILLALSWVMSSSALLRMIETLTFISMFGDGTLTLLPPSERHHTSTPACALLLDEEFSVVLRGTENLVEAITLKGFYFSYPVTDLLQISVWKFVVDLLLEGWFQGLLYLMAILPVWRLIRPSFTSPLSQAIGQPIWVSFFVVITSRGLLQRASRWPDSDFLKKKVQRIAELTAEIVRSVARVAPILVSWFLYIHDYSIYNELQLIMDMVPLWCFAFILSVPSQNYPVRTTKFLGVLGKPPVQKWRFKTPTAAATFQCLVLCHGVRRPVRDIDVRGVLDTLIPDQRDLWTAWKTRIADRIVHETEISFAPTLPTFRDAKLQKQLNVYLDEAQYAYDAYRRWSLAVGLSDK